MYTVAVYSVSRPVYDSAPVKRSLKLYNCSLNNIVELLAEVDSKVLLDGSSIEEIIDNGVSAD